MSIAEENLKSRCHPSCRTCTNECLLLQKLNVNGLALAELKDASRVSIIPFSCTACNLYAVVCNRNLNPGNDYVIGVWKSSLRLERLRHSVQGWPIDPRISLLPTHRAYSQDICLPETSPAETVFFPGCALST